MRVPLGMAAQLGAYIAKNKLWPKPEWQRDPNVAPSSSAFPILRQPSPAKTNGESVPSDTVPPHPMLRKRFPLVLMLEPLHACNLTCTGCGRIREYESTITERIPLEKCLAAVEECGAPIVSICGGEPMMYPQLGELVAGILGRGRHIYLCTNGMYIASRLHEFKPNRRFFFNVHLDGLQETHDMAVEREGVFEEAIAGIQAAKAAGFMVCTNTTVYRETDMTEIEALFEYLQQFDLDGHMLSPGYGYSAVDTREIFLTLDEVREKFKDVDRLFGRFRLTSTPAYLAATNRKRKIPQGRERVALYGLG